VLGDGVVGLLGIGTTGVDSAGAGGASTTVDSAV
jgi:hypothetical protein